MCFTRRCNGKRWCLDLDLEKGLAQFVRVCLKVIAAVIDNLEDGFGVDMAALEQSGF